MAHTASSTAPSGRSRTSARRALVALAIALATVGGGSAALAQDGPTLVGSDADREIVAVETIDTPTLVGSASDRETVAIEVAEADETDRAVARQGAFDNEAASADETDRAIARQGVFAQDTAATTLDETARAANLTALTSGDPAEIALTPGLAPR